MDTINFDTIQIIQTLPLLSNKSLEQYKLESVINKDSNTQKQILQSRINYLYYSILQYMFMKKKFSTSVLSSNIFNILFLPHSSKDNSYLLKKQVMDDIIIPQIYTYIQQTFSQILDIESIYFDYEQNSLHILIRFKDYTNHPFDIVFKGQPLYEN